MDGTRRVIVVIIQVEFNVSRTPLLLSLFSDSLFSIVELPPLKQPSAHDTPGLSAHAAHEIVTVQEALATAKRMDRHAHCIVVKNTSIGAVDSHTMAHAISKAVTLEFDLCYLCKWRDRCELYRVVAGRDDPVTFARTRSPHGVQAILFSPHGRDIMLGDRNMRNGKVLTFNNTLSEVLSNEIYNNNISAICTVNNVVNYDIVYNARENSDFEHANQCLPVDLNLGPREEGHNPFMLALVVLIILILGLAVVWLYRRSLR